MQVHVYAGSTLNARHSEMTGLGAAPMQMQVKLLWGLSVGDGDCEQDPL